MVVQYIQEKYNRRTHIVEVTFAVDFWTYMNMKRSAALTGHPDTLDYIAGNINSAFYKDRITRSRSHTNERAKGMLDDDIPF
ncbi:MAG: hypothetical protein ACU0AY_01065 [Marinibacterium profundimaris]